METDITGILDDLAPVCTSTNRRKKPESRWLSDEAVAGKQTRRRLERRWKSTGSEAARVAYRAACRVANRLIMESRRAFYTRRVTESSRDPHTLWKNVKGLLHMNNQSIYHEPGMCNRFSSFFNEKIVKAKAKISTMKAQLTSTRPLVQTSPNPTDPRDICC